MSDVDGSQGQRVCRGGGASEPEECRAAQRGYHRQANQNSN